MGASGSFEAKSFQPASELLISAGKANIRLTR
jgi:hypothetical protein